MLAVGAASLIVADDHTAQATTIPVTAPPLSPALATLAMQAWMNNGGRDAVAELDDAATALANSETSSSPTWSPLDASG